jgi:LDH2 family malate/lactate/ureidoglycolate dehydrogenase
MKVPLTDLNAKMQTVLKAKGYSDEDIPFIINMYLGGELRGHTSHGLASFPEFIKQDFSQLEKPEILRATAATIFIDAKGNAGVLAGKQAADEAIARAKKEIAGVAIVKNMDIWLRPGAIAEYVAEQGFVAIVINNGASAAIAPPGGYDPVAGTNPIAYAFPAGDSSLVVDMATSKQAWGQVRLANKYGTDLPADTFYNDQGEVTVNPEEAHSVMPFGEYKGFSLALLVQVLTCSLVGNSLLNINNDKNNFGSSLGNRTGLIFVIDPEQTVGLEQFKKANADYFEQIKNTHARIGEEIRIPGEKAGKEKRAKEVAGVIEIPEELWKGIEALS